MQFPPVLCARMFDELQLTEQEQTGPGQTAQLLDGGLSMAMGDSWNGKPFWIMGKMGILGLTKDVSTKIWPRNHKTWRRKPREWGFVQRADVDITDRKVDFSNAGVLTERPEHRSDTWIYGDPSYAPTMMGIWPPTAPLHPELGCVQIAIRVYNSSGDWHCATGFDLSTIFW